MSDENTPAPFSGRLGMKRRTRGLLRTFAGFTIRSTALHVLTYVIIGAASYWLVARPYWTGPDALPWVRNPESEFVQRWFLPAQILRGAIHGVALFPLRNALLDMRPFGGLVVASLLLLIGLIAGISGGIEDWVYSTTFHFGLFMAHLPEVVLQTLVYGYVLLAWERRVERREPAVLAERVS
jgi:hypothetical protein